MATQVDLEVRTMSRDELDLAVDWAAREGWNPGLGDAACFYAADAEGFLIGRLGPEPVGCISVVRYGRDFGFLGFYIVTPERRGCGYGYRLWQAGLQRLEGRTVGLDGVVAQQDNYRRSGFVLAHRNVRFGGEPRCERPSDPRLTPIRSEMLDELIRYDRSFFPASRDSFLRCWLQPQGREGVALIEDGSVRGYGVVRVCRTGFKIGPLFAESADRADLLFRALAAGTDGGPLFLDCPEPNRSATALAARYGLSPVFETARMYRGVAPDLPLMRIYGITTFELG
ncbi:MAG TPA: GNAT family N-acetyltransferase [Microvirga sp.]|nr:GNAT family N-acetyltransferase [Microvirga sp.]